MRRTLLPPIPTIIELIARINRGDVDGIMELATDDHELAAFDGPVSRGRDDARRAWERYIAKHPSYAIHPRRIAAQDTTVAVLGGTTGSHLGLSDAAELANDVLWVADVVSGHIRRWGVEVDTIERRVELGLGAHRAS